MGGLVAGMRGGVEREESERQPELINLDEKTHPFGLGSIGHAASANRVGGRASRLHPERFYRKVYMFCRLSSGMTVVIPHHPDLGAFCTLCLGSFSRGLTKKGELIGATMHSISALAIVPALVALLAPLAAGTALAVELRDAELVAGGSPVLQNGAGTVRLEDARLGRLGPAVFVPEPGALWQLGSGIGLLALLAVRGRSRTASDTGRPEHRFAPIPPC